MRVIRKMSGLVLIPRSLIKPNLFTNSFPVVARYSSKDISLDNVANVEIPSYEPNGSENIDTKKARLLYQSRKRGMLENDLILSTFAAKHLPKMNAEQTKLYDILINLPSNDWDLYNWATGNKPTPPQFENEVMSLLKEHVRNDRRDTRLRQPDLS